jgi:hypothetical protein
MYGCGRAQVAANLRRNCRVGLRVPENGIQHGRIVLFPARIEHDGECHRALEQRCIVFLPTLVDEQGDGVHDLSRAVKKRRIVVRPGTMGCETAWGPSEGQRASQGEELNRPRADVGRRVNLFQVRKQGMVVSLPAVRGSAEGTESCRIVRGPSLLQQLK